MQDERPTNRQRNEDDLREEIDRFEELIRKGAGGIASPPRVRLHPQRNKNIRKDRG